MRKLIGLFIERLLPYRARDASLETAHGVRRYPFQMLSQFSTSSKPRVFPQTLLTLPSAKRRRLLKRCLFANWMTLHGHEFIGWVYGRFSDVQNAPLQGHQTYYRPYSGFGGEKISEGEFNTYLYKYLSGIRKNSIEPDLQLYVHFITLFAFCRNFAGPKSYSRMFKHLGPDIRLYNCLLNVYFRLGEIKRCNLIHDMINDNNVQPNFQTVDVLKKLVGKLSSLRESKTDRRFLEDSKYDLTTTAGEIRRIPAIAKV